MLILSSVVAMGHVGLSVGQPVCQRLGFEVTGVPKLQDQLKNARVDDKMVKRQIAIIGSMTKAERRNPDVLQASRRRRIAAGSGTSVPEVNTTSDNRLLCSGGVTLGARCGTPAALQIASQTLSN